MEPIGWNWGHCLFQNIPGDELRPFRMPSVFFCFLFFFSFIFINWRLITLQYCSGFCHTLTWISHGFTCLVFSRVVLSPDRWPASQSNLEASWQKAGHERELLCERVCGQTCRVLQRCRVISELEALWMWNRSWIKKLLLFEFGSSFLGQQQLLLRLKMYLRGMRCEGELNPLSWKLSFSVQFLETSRLRGERPSQC